MIGISPLVIFVSFALLLHCLGLRARVHVFRGTPFSYLHYLGSRARRHAFRGTSSSCILYHISTSSAFLMHFLGLRARIHAFRGISLP